MLPERPLNDAAQSARRPDSVPQSASFNPAPRDLAARAAQSRRAFLRGSATAAAGLGAAAALLSTPSIARADDGVRQLYAEWRQVRRHENNHVEFLLDVLAGDARPRPVFQGLEQPDYPTFVNVSRTLEGVGVRAYLGATPFIDSPDILAGAASIALIEAAHFAFTNLALFDPITGLRPESLNEDVRTLGPSMYFGFTPAEVGEAAGPFIASLNGGAPISYSETPSTANDIDILNFALALEFLEAEFYNINVRKFFEHG